MTEPRNAPASRADLHCHSTASAVAGLGVQHALGLPECATPPEEVHALAKRRGMDLVTITDHDTIDGVLAIAGRPDVFVSEEERLRARLGRAATFLGWLDSAELAATYASADVFLFCSTTDTFGQAVLEAQASGLPVVAVGAGGPAELIHDGRSGLLCAPRAAALGGAVAGLAGSRAMRERLARGGLAAARERSWEQSLARLATGWRRALAPDGAAAGRPEADRAARAARAAA